MLLALGFTRLPWPEGRVAKRWLLCPVFKMHGKHNVLVGKGQEESTPSVYTYPCRWPKKKNKLKKNEKVLWPLEKVQILRTGLCVLTLF